MADISSIKLPSGNTYDIKDSTARSAIPTKVSQLTNDSGFITGMTILSYGSSTWNDFIEAYNANKVVYCRASSNANPASGSQTRLAFMAYVNNATTPTNVEFQYYRSVSSHTASQQGDQVFVYKLDKTSGWSVIKREASVKVVAGAGLGGTYSNGTMTLTGPTKVSDLTNDSGFITSTTADDTYLPKSVTTSGGLENSITYAQPTREESSVTITSKYGGKTQLELYTNGANNQNGTRIKVGSTTSPTTTFHVYSVSSNTYTSISSTNTTISSTSTTINGVVTPTADGMAANKKYVDDSITAAIGTAIGGSY